MLLSKEQFDTICGILSESGTGISKVCKEVGVSTSSFYKDIDEDINLEKQYSRARSIYIEKRLSDRDELNEKCHKEMKNCDPKRCNAIVTYYKELARQIEWELGKLMRRKYGDDLDQSRTSVTMPSEIRIVMVDPKENIGA
jgi:hypothetical protein